MPPPLSSNAGTTERAAPLEPVGGVEERHPGSTTAGEHHMVERKMDGGEIFIEILNSHGVEYIRLFGNSRYS